MKRYMVSRMLWSRWFMGVIVLGGGICGMLAAGILDPQICQSLGQDIAEYYPTMSGRELSISILQKNIFEILKIYFLGLCLVGIIIIPAYLFFKSFSFGFLILFIIMQNPWQDWQIAFGAVIAPQVLFFPLLIAACSCMVKLSYSSFLYSKRELLKEILTKSALMLIIVLLTVLISLIIGGLITKFF